MEQRFAMILNTLNLKSKSKQYDAIAKKDEKQRELIHNIYHYMREIGIYAAQNNVEAIQQTLKEVQIEFGEQNEMICNNEFMNAMLGEFKNRAESEGVSVEIFVEPGFSFSNLKEQDLTIIFGNLADNALEASVQCDEGRIFIDFFRHNQGEISVLRIRNTYCGNLNLERGQLKTTKKDFLNHGIGLKSVKKTINKYNGYMEQQYSEQVYNTTVVFPQILIV
jgi:sensor histidine kinase regulating citrate/malate metabolism